MTVETVLSGVLLECGLDLPSAQINDSGFETRQILGLMNQAGTDIASRAEWSRTYVDWTIAGAVSSATLPSDFQRMAETGAVRIGSSNFQPIRSVVSPEQWEFLSVNPSAQPYYHIQGGEIHFSPDLTADSVVVRYVSKNWVVGKSAITQNGDELNIPERLLQSGTVWRWKRQRGLPYDDYISEFEADLATEISADRGAP